VENKFMKPTAKSKNSRGEESESFHVMQYLPIASIIRGTDLTSKMKIA
jgi:hypothetical protein